MKKIEKNKFEEKNREILDDEFEGIKEYIGKAYFKGFNRPIDFIYDDIPNPYLKKEKKCKFCYRCSTINPKTLVICFKCETLL